MVEGSMYHIVGFITQCFTPLRTGLYQLTDMRRRPGSWSVVSHQEQGWGEDLSGLMAEDAVECKMVAHLFHHSQNTKELPFFPQDVRILDLTSSCNVSLGRILTGCRSNVQVVEVAAFMISFGREIAASSFCSFGDQTVEKSVCFIRGDSCLASERDIHVSVL